MISARCTTHLDATAEASCARCGDFICRLCGPLEPVALCGRCAARSTVDWEERGEHGLLRAFVSTAKEALASPSRLGRKLAGAGHGLAALSYATLCAAVGLIPLALIAAALLVTVADPMKLGLRSTGVLSVAVSLVLASVAASSVYALGLTLWCLLVWALARLLGADVRYDVLLRASAYGASLLVLPLFGPLLAPVACLMMLHALREALAQRTSEVRALTALGGALAFSALAVWLLVRK